MCLLLCGLNYQKIKTKTPVIIFLQCSTSNSPNSKPPAPLDLHGRFSLDPYFVLECRNGTVKLRGQVGVFAAVHC